MKTNPQKFHSFLMDIYKGAKVTHNLTAKYKISRQSQQACRILNFTNEDNYSNMNAAPTMHDAIILIKKNAQIKRISQKKCLAKKEKMKGQLQLGLPAKKTRQPRQAKQAQPVSKTPTKEINLLWGAIKITL
jgi:hypothetical protein